MEQNYIDIISSLDGTTVIRISDISRNSNEINPSKQEIMERLLHTNGSAVFHTIYGNGHVVESSVDIVTIRFENGETKRFSIKACLENDYLQPFIPAEKQSQKLFASIKWDAVCLECQKKSNGRCRDRTCAQLHYDEWGDYIPPYLYFHDGNHVAKYLEKKRQLKDAERKARESSLP